MPPVSELTHSILSPQLSVESFSQQIETKRQPERRIQREVKEEEEEGLAAVVGRSLPLVLRPQRVYPAYFVQWEWKTSYSGGILKLSVRQ